MVILGANHYKRSAKLEVIERLSQPCLVYLLENLHCCVCFGASSVIVSDSNTRSSFTSPRNGVLLNRRLENVALAKNNHGNSFPVGLYQRSHVSDVLDNVAMGLIKESRFQVSKTTNMSSRKRALSK